MTNETKRRWVVLWGLAGGRANRRSMKESVARATAAQNESVERSAAGAAARALGPDHERRWGWLLRRRSRRVLVVASVATWALLLAGGLAPEPTWERTAFAFLLSVACYFLLREASRLITELPEIYLDERQLRIRDESFTIAYKVLSGVLGVVAGLGVAGLVIASSGDTPTFPAIGYEAGIAAALSLGMTMQSLPAAVLAWREPDLQQ
jgi:hypothetical protein